MQMLCLCSSLLFVLNICVGNSDFGFCDWLWYAENCIGTRIRKYGNKVIHVHLYSSVKTKLISWIINE